MKKRLNQRIVQALGRCNRSGQDFGLYILADQRFATHFSSESNREGLPRNIVAEIDMAQDSAENDLRTLVKEVNEFLRGDFTLYDSAMQSYLDDVPAQQTPHAAVPDTSFEEVRGWTALFDSQNYQIAANRFEECWTALRDTPLRELGAFHGWYWAKALYLQSRLGEQAAGERSSRVLEEAITHGGQSGWFNRMRASLNRARHSPTLLQEVAQLDYATAVIQAFDEQLERLGTWGDKFERWCSNLTEQLTGDNHKQYQEGLEKLGQLLGYRAVRPRNNAAADCLWRGVFGNAREIITFEAKIEHDALQHIVAKDIGQAHNQRTRAEREYSGFTVRTTIVTHLTALAPDAESAAGSIKILEKEAVLVLWNRVRALLSRYRDGWSLDSIAARLDGAQAIRAYLPKIGWLIKVLDADQRFITSAQLCEGWP